MQDLRVLLVEDDDEDAEITRRILAHAPRIRCAVTWIDSYERAGEAIRESAYDVILLDYRLDRGTGLDLLKETGAAENLTPVILLTGQDDPELDRLAMAAGVVDFLEKGKLDPLQLDRSIRYAIDRKRIEGELKNSHAAHAFLRSIIDALPDHLAIIDPAGGLIAVNEPWIQHARKSLIPYDALIPGSSLPAVCATHAANADDTRNALDGIRDVLNGTRASFQMEYSCETGSGQLWFVLRATPFDASRQAFVVVTHSDITERKQLGAQLRHAQKMEAIGQLAGGVAHDFNNILTAVKAYTELLLADPTLNESHANDVKEISFAADRAADLTRQLLAFSRKESVNPRMFDLNAQLSNLQNMLARVICEDVHLKLSLGDGPLPISIDPAELEQIVMNLVVNGRDAMPDGGPLTLQTFWLELEPDSPQLLLGRPPGKYVVLTVTDTGIGMDAETSARIFEPFFTTKAVGKGTGLGLATVFGIVTRAGGFIRVESRPSGGTTFRLYFPFAMASEIENATAVSARSDGHRSAARILFVEDESTLRDLGARILRPHGYEVCLAENGREALEICERDSGGFDLALVDVVMPEMGGDALVERLSKLYPATKVVMMSGYIGDEALSRRLADKAGLFIPKPYTPDFLVRTVREALATNSPGLEGSRKLA